MQRTLLAEQEPSKAADILEEMPAHEAASALRDLPDTEAQGIINRMETEAARHVRMILLHEEETAGSVMATTCFEARPQETARDVLARVRERASGVQVLTSIYVLDDDRRLIGVASLRDLFRAPPEAALESLMNRQVVQVTADTHFKEVAQLFVKYGFRNIPVVDGEGRLLGAMRLKDVLTNLAPEIRP
jgi:magnesium transporter